MAGFPGNPFLAKGALGPIGICRWGLLTLGGELSGGRKNCPLERVIMVRNLAAVYGTRINAFSPLPGLPSLL